MTGDRALGSARLQVGADVTGRYGVTAEDTTTSFNLAGAVTAIRENPSIESARRTNAAVFAQLDAPVARAMTASGGLRADVVRNVNTGGFFGDRAVLTGAVAGYGALSVGPFAGTTFTVQIARGFRDPTLSDRFYRGPVGRGFVQGNPDLRPETSLQLDVGARHVRRRLRAAAYYYEYRITDLVERYAAGAELFLFRNRGEARLRGGEVEAQLDLPRGFSIEAMAQASQGRGGDGAPLDDVPPRELAVVARHAGRWRLAWFVRLARVAPHRDAGPSEVATPGYGLVDAGGTWTIARHLEVRAVARNLANASYPSSAGPRWVLAPGRRGSITVVVTF